MSLDVILTGPKKHHWLLLLLLLSLLLLLFLLLFGCLLVCWKLIWNSFYCTWFFNSQKWRSYEILLFVQSFPPELLIGIFWHFIRSSWLSNLRLSNLKSDGTWLFEKNIVLVFFGTKGHKMRFFEFFEKCMEFFRNLRIFLIVVDKVI